MKNPKQNREMKINNQRIKYVVGACLVGMVLASCQSWKFKGVQFPIVLRSPINWEYFTEKAEAEAKPQREQSEVVQGADATVVEKVEKMEQPDIRKTGTSPSTGTDSTPQAARTEGKKVKKATKKKEPKKTGAKSATKPATTPATKPKKRPVKTNLVEEEVPVV